MILKIRESKGYLQDEIRVRDNHIEKLLNEKKELFHDIDELKDEIKTKD